jgi:hypothetical protein
VRYCTLAAVVAVVDAADPGDAVDEGAVEADDPVPDEDGGRTTDEPLDPQPANPAAPNHTANVASVRTQYPDRWALMLPSRLSIFRSPRRGRRMPDSSSAFS